MTITEIGECRAETVPFSSALIAIDPIATPIENITRKRLATSLLAWSTFLASGGNWMNRTAPIVQKKLIAMIAKYTRRLSIVLRTSVIDERKIWKSSGWRAIIGGAGGTWRPAKKPAIAVQKWMSR